VTNFSETFAPVAELQSLRMMLALVASHEWDICEMDGVTAPLTPKFDEDTCVAVPSCVGLGAHRVCKQEKSPYGLRQALTVFGIADAHIAYPWPLHRVGSEILLVYINMLQFFPPRRTVRPPNPNARLPTGNNHRQMLSGTHSARNDKKRKIPSPSIPPKASPNRNKLDLSPKARNIPQMKETSNSDLPIRAQRNQQAASRSSYRPRYALAAARCACHSLSGHSRPHRATWHVAEAIVLNAPQ